MKKPESKAAMGLMLSLLLVNMLSMASTMSVKAQNSADSYTVGLWHLDEVKADGYREITPDLTGAIPGTLGGTPSPMLVEGKFEKALKFDGTNFVYVPITFLVGFPPSPQPIFIPISPILDVPKEIKIEAWINVQQFTEATYNNIVAKVARLDPQWQNITRVVGLAVRASSLGESSSASEGKLSGFVSTDTGGFNEIETKESVISLNQWIHVAFTRTSTGMRLYVDGFEESVNIIHGVQNPTGSILNGSEIYFGHDSKVTIDEIRISNLAPEPQTVSAQVDIGPNLLVAVIVIAVVFAIAWLLRRIIQMWALRSKA